MPHQGLSLPSCRIFVAGLCFFLAFSLLSPLAGGGEWSEAENAGAVERDGNEDAGEDLIFSEMAEAFRRHCVRVYIHGKSHEGETPSVGEFDDDIRYERPTLVGGYWWDERHVIIADPVLPDYFIRLVEVEVPGSDTRYPARIVGRFVKLEAMLLEVGDGADDSAIPQAHPLEFIDGELDDAVTMTYAWKAGQWRLSMDSGLGTSMISDTGKEMVEFGAEGVLVDANGFALGLSFGERAAVSEDDAYWYGRELAYTPLLMRRDIEETRNALGAKLAGAVREARFRIRIKVEDDEDDLDWSFDMEDGPLSDGSAVVRAPALVVGKRHLFVPVALPPQGIARIEDVVVVSADGTEIPVEFAGAFREYMAVMLEAAEDLPADNLPEGFSSLNPFAPERAAEFAPWPEMEFIHRWRIDYALGRRRERVEYDRWRGTFRGYRGDTVVETRTNEGDGAMAFDRDGRLVAFAVTPRLLSSGMSGLATIASPAFRPLDFLARKLRAEGAIDPSLHPVDGEFGQRLIDLGVEFQPLDNSLARLFHVSGQTRGGKIGLLVTHVYPGSIADDIGLREHDVLLRLFIAGRTEPVDLQSGGYLFADGSFDIDMSSEAFQRLLQYMPPPWPSRDNALSTILTGAGIGREIAVEYVREGESARAEFKTRYFDPDYRNARRERFPLLGLTVKPITYEVARFFGRGEKGGVIVSKVEDGSKGGVAGLHHYLLITHVNGAAVGDIDDFTAKVREFEVGGVGSIELTVESFGKTRLVKIE